MHESESSSFLWQAVTALFSFKEEEKGEKLNEQEEQQDKKPKEKYPRLIYQSISM